MPRCCSSSGCNGARRRRGPGGLAAAPRSLPLFARPPTRSLCRACCQKKKDLPGRPPRHVHPRLRSSPFISLSHPDRALSWLLFFLPPFFPAVRTPDSLLLLLLPPALPLPSVRIAGKREAPGNAFLFSFPRHWLTHPSSLVFASFSRSAVLSVPHRLACLAFPTLLSRISFHYFRLFRPPSGESAAANGPLFVRAPARDFFSLIQPECIRTACMRAQIRMIRTVFTPASRDLSRQPLP